MKTRINLEAGAEREFLRFRKTQVPQREPDAFAIFLSGMSAGIRVAKKVYNGEVQDPYAVPND